MIGSTSVLPVSTVCDLGIVVDCDLVMHTRVPHCLVLLCHAVSDAQHPLPCLCISHPVTRHCVIALVLCRLDYSNSTLSRTQPLV